MAMQVARATIIEGRTIHVDDEGFLAYGAEWDDELAAALARQIGIELTDEHWQVIRFARKDFAAHKEAPTLRRISTGGEIPLKRLFELFPQKPAKKVAYVAGLPKPVGCV